MKSVLDALVARARVEVRVESDPALMRPSDTPVLLGDATKLRKATGWQPGDSVRADARRPAELLARRHHRLSCPHQALLMLLQLSEEAAMRILTAGISHHHRIVRPRRAAPTLHNDIRRFRPTVEAASSRLDRSGVTESAPAVDGLMLTESLGAADDLRCSQCTDGIARAFLFPR